MAYKFIFDLSRIPRFFFTEITKIGYRQEVHKKLGKALQEIIKKFRIQEMTGLNLSDAMKLIEDLIDIQARNLIEREEFIKSEQRALLFPHCARKHMDKRCQAKFDSKIPSYFCNHCTPDCQINIASSIARKKGYDIYILPGGSCITKILETKKYNGIVAIACGEEIKMGSDSMNKKEISGQAVPLIKNGCANTLFNLETLRNVL